MILDTIEQACRYAALNPHFEKAVEFMSRPDLAELASGKYPIDGENVWATVTEGVLKSEADARPETHDRYTDIQITLRGVETYGWKPRAECREPAGSYDPQKDILFWNDRATAFIALHEREFVVFFSEDAHQPMIGEGPVKKCVIKVRNR